MQYNYSGELDGKVDSDKAGFHVDGSFASEAKTIVPGEVAKYMPAEALGALNTVNNGSATADADFSSDKSSISGTITFTGTQATVVADFSAIHSPEYSDAP